MRRCAFVVPFLVGLTHVAYAGPPRVDHAVAIAAIDGTARDATEEPTAVRAGSTAAEPGRNLLYVELLGKGGLYGVGFERRITPRLSLGIAGSFAVVRDQQVLTVAPYVHGTLVRGRRHAMFAELGATLVHSRLPSPVDDWDGMTDTGGGGFASLGWERAGTRVVVRAAGSVVVGEGGIAPWAGFAIGVRP